MKMTINEAIKEMELEFSLFLENNDLTTPDSISDMRADEDFNKVYTANLMALDIMRKYEKIQEIVGIWSEDLIDYEGHYGDDYMEKIEEVLEDGTDN